MKTKTGPFDVIGHLATLRRYARSLVRDSDVAEDLVQDALVRAYERKGTFRKDGNLRNWLLSIVHNAHIDRVRRSRASVAREGRVAAEAETLASPVQEDAVRLSQVRAAFAALPEEQREALHLVGIEDLTYQEAADVLGIPVGTLMSRISRARARLRAMEEGVAGKVAQLRIVGGRHHDDT